VDGREKEGSVQRKSVVYLIGVCSGGVKKIKGEDGVEGGEVFLMKKRGNNLTGPKTVPGAWENGEKGGG